MSENGKDWVVVKKGEFSNIVANPVERLVSLKDQIKGRYFKFEGLHAGKGKGVSVAELGVVAN